MISWVYGGVLLQPLKSGTWGLEMQYGERGLARIT